ncbi:MAG: dUTPase [Ktedonobacterales bacterium]
MGDDFPDAISDDIPTTKTRAVTAAHISQHSDEAKQDADQTQRDRLTDLFARQAELGQFYREQRTTGFYSEEPITHCTTWTRAIVHECCELDNELNWKPWKNPRPLDANREERLLEMADILHFFLQLALDQNFSADDIYAAYLRKNEENRERQQSDPRYRP